jgi:protein O-GlcNAc transferase
MVQPSREVPFQQGRMALGEALETGFRFQREGRLTEAERVYNLILLVAPELPQALYRLSLLALHAGDDENALELIRRALSGAPGVAAFHELHGRVLKAMNRTEAAVECYRQAIALAPRVASVQVSLGIALKALGRLDEAIECYRRALELDPELPEAHHNLGNALWIKDNSQGQWAQHYQRALGPRMQSAEAIHKKGLALHAQKRHEEALACFRAALEQVPDFAPAHCSVGLALVGLNRVDEAEACFLEALALRADYPPAQMALGNVYWFQGRIEEADACYLRALDLQPKDGLRIRRAMLLPTICQSTEDILVARSRYEKELDALIGQAPRTVDPVSEVAATSFYLSYHGLDNRDLQVKLAHVALQATPGLNWIAPHCREGKRRDGPIRVGFISAFLYSHSIGRTTRGFIAEMTRDDFEVIALFVPPAVDDGLSAFIRQKSDRCVDLPNSLDAARQCIAELELDVLFYQDIGMEPFTYYLAQARLAPVQCVSFGHPETTGIANMDYFISSDLFEIDNADAHYSEKLIRLPNLGTLAYYYRPEHAAEAANRRDAGVAEGERFYLCPQTLYKLHPDFDAIIGGLLRDDPAGRLVLIEGKSAQWGRQLRQRLAHSIPDVCDRITFVAQRSTREFLRLIAAADVILDTLHFNGMNTSLEAFAAGVPIVTLPGEFQRGRHTQGMYRRMGFVECVARDAGDYVRIASRLGCDPAYNRYVRREIALRREVLYEDRNVVREFEKFFRAAVSGRPSDLQTGKQQCSY